MGGRSFTDQISKLRKCLISWHLVRETTADKLDTYGCETSIGYRIWQSGIMATGYCGVSWIKILYLISEARSVPWANMQAVFTKHSQLEIPFYIVFVCLQITPSHYHHYTDLSEGSELLKCLVRYMLSSVCLRFRQFSQSSFVQYLGLRVFSLPNSPVMIMGMCTLSYYHHQIGSMKY